MINLEAVWMFVYRFVLGVTLIIHGYPKLKDRAKSAGQWMQSMGIPYWTAFLAMLVEVVGGTAIILGFLTRLAALFLAVFMIANVFMKKSKMKAVYVSVEKPSYEVDVLYLILALTLLVIGPGALSVDSALGLTVL